MVKQNPDPRIKRIGMRLRQLRREHGESMAIHSKIAKKYNIRMKQSHYSKIERGVAAPPLRTLFAIADYFGVSILDFFDPPEAERDSKLHYILHNPPLHSLLLELEERSGPQKAAQYLKLLISMLLEMLQESNASAIQDLQAANRKKGKGKQERKSN